MEPPARIKMTDVARHAGVSVATVSKVVNRRYGVSQSTLEGVDAVIAELGYEASLGARSLRSLRTNVIGVLVSQFEPFSTEVLKGVGDAIGDTDYDLIVYAGRHQGDRVGWERRSLARLGGSVIDGAIVVTPSVLDTGNGGIPVVTVDPHVGPNSVPTVDSDNYRGAVTGTEYLISLGHRRICFLGGRAGLESAIDREKGFRDAMAGAGVEVDESLMSVADYRADLAEAPARELLSRPDRPTAVFAANDLTAIRTMEVARALGLRVPEDVSVLGFDNVPESALSTPPLTTIEQPLKAIGATALRMLVSMLDGLDPQPTHVRLQTSMVERASCGPLATQAPAGPQLRR